MHPGHCAPRWAALAVERASRVVGESPGRRRSASAASLPRPGQAGNHMVGYGVTLMTHRPRSSSGPRQSSGHGDIRASAGAGGRHARASRDRIRGRALTGLTEVVADAVSPPTWGRTVLGRGPARPGASLRVRSPTTQPREAARAGPRSALRPCCPRPRWSVSGLASARWLRCRMIWPTRRGLAVLATAAAAAASVNLDDFEDELFRFWSDRQRRARTARRPVRSADADVPEARAVSTVCSQARSSPASLAAHHPGGDQSAGS